MGRNYLILPAAGCGVRMGGTEKKQFMTLQGKEILVRTVEALSACPELSGILIMCGKDDLNRVLSLVQQYELTKVAAVLTGGATRQESVAIGLRNLPKDAELVAIHDGVRPFVTAGLLSACFEAASRFGAVCPALPVKETVKISDENGFIQDTPPRASLYAAQTPQTFRAGLIRKAYQLAEEAGDRSLTDDASAVEFYTDTPVRLIPGEAENIKITTPADLSLATLLLDRRLSS